MVALTAEQAFRVAVVYASSIVPLLCVVAGVIGGRMPRWVVRVYAGTFALCALGWELWLTYGWVAGDPVSERRAEALNHWIPQDVNWLLNSLADAGAIGLVGLALVWFAYGRTPVAFRRWHWGAFAILLVWFVAQNLWVELRIYHAQLAPGMALSWAPLIPTGPWWNPVLFELGGRTVQFQTQIPWVLATPLFYALTLRAYRRSGPAPG